MVFPTSQWHVLLWIALTSFTTSARAEQICGGIGKHNYSSTNFYMGNFFFNSPSSFGVCADFCKNDERCRSLRYSYYADANSQYCEFFPDWVESYFIEDGEQPYYYFDVDCAFPPFGVTQISYETSTTTVAATTYTKTLATTTTEQIATTQTRSFSFTQTQVVTSVRLTTLYVTSSTRATTTSTSYSFSTRTSTFTYRITAPTVTVTLKPTTLTYTSTTRITVPTTTTKIVTSTKTGRG